MVAYSGYDSDQRVRRYAETLTRCGYRVDAISLKRAGQQKEEVLNGVRVLRIQGRVRSEKNKFSYLAKLLLFFWRSMILLTREHIRERYDLIHVHSVPDFEVFAALYPKLAGAKIILDIHDIVPEFYASKFNVSRTSLGFRSLVLMERMSTAFADHVIAANHIWERRLKERSVAASKCSTFLNYPDRTNLGPCDKNRSDGRFIILYPGSLNHHQGVDIAIRAFARIQARVPQAEFHIYGWGDSFELLRTLIDDLGLQERVFLNDLLPMDQIRAVIANADLGIVPKRKNAFGNEAFSTKILEFMVMGVPAVVPDTAIDTYYFDSSVVRFFRAGNEESLAATLLEIIENQELRKNLVRNASHFVRKYTWDVNEYSYIDLVASLVGGHNGHNGKPHVQVAPDQPSWMQ
jgi:glycosyltransferase involved in cell wall biosynthesis